MSLKLNKYLLYLRKNAVRYGRIDINGSLDNSFFGKYLKKIICFSAAIFLVYFLDNGFSQVFISYASTVLSILIGLFITAIIFSFDKFHQLINKGTTIYDINYTYNSSDKPDKHIQISVKNISEQNSKEKLWDTQSYNYSKQFAFITGYSIVLCVFTLVLLSFSTLFENFMNININNYNFNFLDINIKSVSSFILLTFVVLQRFFVLYWIASVMYNTLFLVSSMVNFLTVKVDRNND